MSKQCLDMKQMQHLQDLGVDTSKASVYWVRIVRPATRLNEKEKVMVDWTLHLQKEIMHTPLDVVKIIPTFTLQDILDLLPKRIIDEKGFDYFLAIHIYNNIWNVVYSLYNEILVTINYFNSECLIDAAYEILCWCIENGYVETKNKNNK